MTELRLDEWTFPSANLGEENPLPPLHSLYNESTESLKKRGAPAKGPLNLRVFRAGGGSLPHRMLDGYDRIRTPRKFRMAVLENQHLKASFLLERGARLWSLVHKASGRELLHCNPVFQPANLAIRNAWFAGGVEWNCGVIGHSVYTCTPYWAARVESDRGPVLRLYEFDRLRALPYQVDCYLPEDSQFLYVRVRVVNPHDFSVPMYWWSNISLEETKELRILSPTEFVYTHDHGDPALKKAKIIRDGVDQSYPVNRASDGYFAIAPESRPWVAGVDGKGVGLVQTSTARLRGRKKFAFSQESGGRRWQEFLSGPGHAYMEVQAGLARNQAEYMTMPGNTEWAWLEAYGLMQIDGKTAHDTNYEKAYLAGEEWLDRNLKYPWLESELVATEGMSLAEPVEILQRGSAWGPLERKRREKARISPACPAGLVFDDASLDGEAAQWQALLETGELPYRPSTETPGTYMTQTEWMKMLESALKKGKGVHWLSYLHLGVMYYHHQEQDKAKGAWERSIELEPSAWAYRNLAVLAKDQDRVSDAGDLYVQACRIHPELWQLASEACTMLLEAERPQQVLDLLAGLPESVTSRPRLQVIRGKALLDLGDLETVERILSDIELTDVREGEFSLTELWYHMHVKRISKAEGVPITQALRERVWHEFPPPARIDFRLWAAQQGPTPEEPKKKGAAKA